MLLRTNTQQIIPLSKGGKNVLDNIVTLCKKCYKILELIDRIPRLAELGPRCIVCRVQRL